MIITFSFRAYTDRPKKKQKKIKYDKRDYEAMRSAMRDYDWKENVNALSVEEHWRFFKETLAKHMKKHIPKTSGRPSKPGRHLWMNAKALAQVKKKVHSFKSYMETREGEDYAAYARARNQARWACRNAVRDFKRTLARESKSYPKAFFKYAKSKLKTKASIPDLEKQNGLKTSNDNKKAEVINEFFSRVFTRENLHGIPDFPPRPIREQFRQLHITLDMVKQKLKKLKPNKTPGMDGIHPRVLCELKEEVAEPLADLMNKTLKKSELPQK